MPEKPQRLSCPSAQPEMEGAQILGVVTGTPDALRVAYLTDEITPDASLRNRLGSLPATLVFRFSAKCEESRCAHFDGSRCSLARRIVEKLDPVVDALPGCRIRASCRWYAEQGAGACLRCPQVVTMIPADDALHGVAQPE